MKWINRATLVLVALTSVVASSRADFTVTAVRTDLGASNAITTSGNGTLSGGFGMIRFYAENLGASATVENQGTNLNSVDITMTDLGAGSLVIGGYNEPSGLPAASDAADLFGQHEVSAVGGTYRYKQTLTTTTNAPKYVSFVNMLGDPSVSSDNNPNQVFNVINSPSPANTYSNYGYGIKSFRVIYGSTNGVGVNATTANSSLGALFAVAVVPIGDSVNVQGQFGGDPISGTPDVATNFNYTSTVLPGDANLDGSVNAIDLQILLNRFNTSGNTWSTGDFNGDGLTNAVDLQGLLNNFNHSSPPAALPSAEAASAVPEPATIAFMLPLSVLALKRKRS